MAVQRCHMQCSDSSISRPINYLDQNTGAHKEQKNKSLENIGKDKKRVQKELEVEVLMVKLCN